MKKVVLFGALALNLALAQDSVLKNCCEAERQLTIVYAECRAEGGTDMECMRRTGYYVKDAFQQFGCKRSAAGYGSDFEVDVAAGASLAWKYKDISQLRACEKLLKEQK